MARAIVFPSGLGFFLDAKEETTAQKTVDCRGDGGKFETWAALKKRNSRILILTPGAIVPNSADNRSTKPGIKVVPPVTTTLASKVACKSGSTWLRVARIRFDKGWRAEGGWDGIVDAEAGRTRVVNWRAGRGEEEIKAGWGRRVTWSERARRKGQS